MMSLVLRGSAREIVIVDRTRKRALAVATVLRDERIVIPIGSYNANYGATLSVPSVLGREGVVKILEPELAENERQALQRSAETLKSALARIKKRA